MVWCAGISRRAKTAMKPAMMATRSTPTRVHHLVRSRSMWRWRGASGPRRGAEGYEFCDDGNQADDDACRQIQDLQRAAVMESSAPTWAKVLRLVRRCDDGNEVDADACRNGCVMARCGDGVVRTDLQEGDNGFEACDDGNANNDDDCSNECRVPGRCGGWEWNGGRWHTHRVNMSCQESLCAAHGGFDAATSRHTGNQVGRHFWPNKREGRNWVAIECSSTDNNTNWGATGAQPDPNWRHAACHVNCSRATTERLGSNSGGE